MSTALDLAGSVWPVVLERFERHAPAGMMARMALEHALPASWVDAVFEAHRQKQYARELLFSTVVELTTLVSLGLRPSLHAAARQMPTLPVSLGSLYDKVNHTEPGILRAWVRGSAERLAPVMAALSPEASLPGWRVRVLDGNHLPASEKRLAPLRGFRGAALPGQSLVVYDPDSGLVSELVACEDAHVSERAAVAPLLDSAQPGELWIADRHFCTRTVLQAWQDAGAGFIVREHARHPRLVTQGAWHERGRSDTGQVREQAIEIKHQQAPWRRIELALDAPTEDGETTIRMWSNLPEVIAASQIAALYRTRWRIEGLFGRLESVLNSEMASLGHPRAALLGFAVSVLAYNILTLLQRCIAQAHQRPHEPPPEVSTYHLALQVRDSFQGLLIAVPPEAWPAWDNANPSRLAERLLSMARHINPRQVATSKRKPKQKAAKGYVDGKTARAHVATARVLAQARTRP
jgi:IS4 transposase